MTNDIDVDKTRRDLDIWTVRLEQTVADLYKEIALLRDGDCDGSHYRTN
jgi:hypothetical protein